MSIADVVIIVAVVAVVVVAVRRFAGTASGKRDCCSGDVKDAGAGGTHAEAFPEAHVSDTDESHYPHAAVVEVGGMHCENCVRHVTNALDSIDGVWAQVTLQGGTAQVHAKDPVDEAAIRDVVGRAGYRVLSVRVTA